MLKKKIIGMAVATLIVSMVISGCGKDEPKSKKELLEDPSDKKVSVVVLTQSEKKDPASFNTAKSKQEESSYSNSIGRKPEHEIRQVVIPDSLDSSSDKEKMNKIIDEIKNNKDVGVVVFTSKSEGMDRYARKLKSERKDIMTISASTPEDDKTLAKSYDLSFRSSDKENPEEVASRAKSLGANRFLYISTPDVENSDLLFEELTKEAKRLSLPIDRVDVEGSTKEEKKIKASQAIDDYLKKYSNDINVYSKDSDLDEVIMTKLVRDRFYVAEFSHPNSTLKLAEIYRISAPLRTKYNFATMNTMIQTYYASNYNIERMVASQSMDPDYFLVNMACEIGINIKSKDSEINKAYNSYYLEKLASTKLLVSSGFINSKQAPGKVKIVTPDVVVY